jgi:hypothetical protein
MRFGECPMRLLNEFGVERLEEVMLNSKQKYLGCCGLRTPIVYPVYLNE